MPVIVKITKMLGPLWATEEEFRELDDRDIIELVREDVAELLDGATWDITRTGGARERSSQDGQG